MKTKMKEPSLLTKKTLTIFVVLRSLVILTKPFLRSETKIILEQKAKHDKIKKRQYAVLYASAVIEWYLNNH